MRTPQIVLSPIGTNRPSLSIPGVSQIRGVLIDNPSGAWLLLMPTRDYIPPYTIGFSRSFEGGHASIDILFPSAGPAGEVTTFAGDPPLVVLDDEPVGNSVGASTGTAFVKQFTPVLSTDDDFSVPVSGLATQNVFASVANQRYRLMSCIVSYNIVSGAPVIPTFDSPVGFAVRNNVDEFFTGIISPAMPVFSAVFPAGLDAAVGFPIGITAKAYWADSAIRVRMSAQLI